MREPRIALHLLAFTVPALVVALLGRTLAAEAGAAGSQPCGSSEKSVEGPAFDPENVCADVPPPQVGEITNPEMQQPDESAWTIFSEINRPVDGVPFWRTWPEQAEVFPADPNPDDPPQWSAIAGAEPAFRGRPIKQQQILAERTAAAAGAAVDDPAHECTALAHEAQEEVRLNRGTFDYVIDNHLWYVEGKAKAFAADFDVSFPTDSREAKANWIEIDASQEGSYVSARDSSGQLWGLVAMHIVSKEVPNWIWATFEHVTNPCYDVYLKAQDRFGLTPDGKVSPALLALFEEYGLDTDVYSNYRLDGAQVDFTDPTGRPIILGNSVTEFGFQTTASCMTCHARATTDAKGSGTLSIFNSQGQSDHGTPDPGWYFSSFSPETRTYLPLDFLWSVALCPNAIGSTQQNCSLPPVDG